jgi:hypothetical protein
MIYYPAITRVRGEGILDESRDALLVGFAGEKYWIPRRVAEVVDYNNAILDVQAWFARQCLRGVSAVSRKREAAPLDELVPELRFPAADTLASQHKSRQHQREAFEKLKDSRVFALLMKCRTGKTKVGIDLACQHLIAGHVRRVLWLCPVSVIPTARWQWGRFAQTETGDNLRFFGLETLSSCKLERYHELLDWVKQAPTLCVIDESHMIKTVNAKRSRRAERLAQHSAARGIMSGSPITKDIRDMFWQFFTLDWRILGYRNIHQFDKNHIEWSTKFPGLVAQTRNDGFIGDRTRPFIYECFPPDSAEDTHQTIYVAMSERQRKLYEWVKDRMIENIRQSDDARIDIYLLFVALQSVLSGYISRSILRHICGKEERDPITLTSPKAAALLDNRASIDGRCIVWCSRRHEVESVASALPDTYVVTGNDAPAKRHEIIQAFRESDCGTLVAMVQVAKRGIDIFEADTAYFYGQSFDFESREQAWHRIQAPGIKETPCHYVDMVYQDSLDERILSSHGRKENIIRSFLFMMKNDRNRAIKEMEEL